MINWKTLLKNYFKQNKTCSCWKLVEKNRNIWSNHFCGKRHFENDGNQNYLVFQTAYRYFKIVSNNDNILSWKSKGLSDESIKPPSTSNKMLNPSLNYVDTKVR